MKKLLQYISIPLLMSVLGACYKLDVPITTELTPDVFPRDSAQFVAASGPAYVALRGNTSVEYFFLQTLSTDEAIFPAKGGNWYNGAEFQQLHYHTWTKDNGIVNGNWTWLSTIIGTVNQTMSILSKNVPEGTFKQTNLAELRMLRALAYFMMMDNYGNVPLDTVNGDFTPKPNVPRAQVFNFVEQEIKACIPYLGTDPVATYGRANKWMAYTLLAKMYLNAEIYTGTERNNDCIAACDNVIQSNQYALEPKNSYLQMFYPNNGPQMKEFIFAIPFDPSWASSFPFRCQNLHARYDIPRGLAQQKYHLPFTPDGAICTLPEYYVNFNDPGDIRNKQWLTGLQYLDDGVTPATVTTTKKGYDQFYTGADGSAPFTYQIDLKPEVTLRQDVASFDVGNDEIAWNMGYRNTKIYPDATSLNRNQKNDIPFFRYSDVILMKAEAILRGGAPTQGQTALSLVNQLRAERSSSPAWGAVTLEDIYAERVREFAWESWHRNDIIRFGKYEGKWGFKTDADPNKRIFPIPTTAFQLNPALTQNPGYPQ